MKSSRHHTGHEFGQSARSGSPYAGMDGPMIGAAASIIIDGIAERESGITPPPPPISVRAFITVFVVMFVIGVVGLVLMLRFFPQPGPVPANLPSTSHVMERP